MYENGKLGPHEGKEVELLLSGGKEVAVFIEGLPETARMLCKKDELCHFKKTITTHSGQSLELDFLYLPDYKVNACELYDLMKKSISSPGYDIALEKKIGVILGYSDADINAYIQHLKDLGHI